jgi:hypothetical protein
LRFSFAADIASQNIDKRGFYNSFKQKILYNINKLPEPPFLAAAGDPRVSFEPVKGWGFPQDREADPNLNIVRKSKKLE